MRRVVGGILVLAGVILLYLFGAMGALAPRAGEFKSNESLFWLPLQTLGTHYPKDALCLAGGLAALIWGLSLLVRGVGAAPPLPTTWSREGRSLAHAAGPGAKPEGMTGTYTRGFCLLSLGACVAIGLAALGAYAGARAAPIGGFVLVAGAALGAALVVGILTFFEKDKPVLVLAAGWILFLIAAGFGLAGFVLSG
jgi:hypothetical protein